MTDTSIPAASFTIVRDSIAGAPPAGGGAVIALGNFDGVHRGHRAVIAKAQMRAKSIGRPALAMTFEPHPRAYFDPASGEFLLTTLDDKLRLLAGTGLAGAIVMSFDAALAGLGAAEFVSRVLVDRYKVAGVAVGFDFRYGKGQAGTPESLRAAGETHGFAVDVAPALKDAEFGDRVSSGAIRAGLRRGEVELAAQLLGYPWFISGTVEPGDKRGRVLGFPTANIRPDPQCGLKHGVYAVRVGVDGKRYDGVANYGRRPMFDSGVILLEAFLFDFSGDLYGKKLDVAFYGFLRPELKFRSRADLIDRMGEDTRAAKKVLAAAGDAFPPLADRTILA